MGVIAVMTAGEVDRGAAACVQTCVSSSFGMESRWLEPLGDPEFAYDRSRRQYSSTLVLRQALARVPADAMKLLVLTEGDIFIPMLSFVYGQAQLNGATAVLSFARLRQEFYGLPGNYPLFLLRVRKEVQHEVGHTFGLTHCQDPLCTMRISTNIQQLDTKHPEFCSTCEVLLRDALAAARHGDLHVQSGGSQ